MDNVERNTVSQNGKLPSMKACGSGANVNASLAFFATIAIGSSSVVTR